MTHIGRPDGNWPRKPAKPLPMFDVPFDGIQFSWLLNLNRLGQRQVQVFGEQPGRIDLLVA